MVEWSRFQSSILSTMIVALVSLVSIQTALALDIGDEAPDFSINSQQKLSDLAGTVVYVDFWASWCAPCLQSFPWMEKIANQFQGKKFRIITVNVDEERAEADRFLSKINSKLPVVYDPAGELPAKYGLTTMPTAYLVDGKRRLVSIQTGFREGEKDAVEATISRLIEKQGS